MSQDTGYLHLADVCLVLHKRLWLKLIRKAREEGYKDGSGHVLYTSAPAHIEKRTKGFLKDIERQRSARLVPPAAPWTDASPRALRLHANLTPYHSITTSNSPYNISTWAYPLLSGEIALPALGRLPSQEGRLVLESFVNLAFT